MYDEKKVPSGEKAQRKYATPLFSSTRNGAKITTCREIFGDEHLR